MEIVNINASAMVGINGPCMTASMEDIEVVSTVYTLRQLVLPADETCSIHTACMLVDYERDILFLKLTSGKMNVTTGFSWV